MLIEVKKEINAQLLHIDNELTGISAKLTHDEPLYDILIYLPINESNLLQTYYSSYKSFCDDLKKNPYFLHLNFSEEWNPFIRKAIIMSERKYNIYVLCKFI